MDIQGIPRKEQGNMGFFSSLTRLKMSFLRLHPHSRTPEKGRDGDHHLTFLLVTGLRERRRWASSRPASPHPAAICHSSPAHSVRHLLV